MSNLTTIELVGGGGEPVDLWRTINSHGLVALPPTRIDVGRQALEATLAFANAKPRTLRIAGRRNVATIKILGMAPSKRVAEQIGPSVRHILRLDEDLSGFYEAILDDPDLAWAAEGAGRLIRSATVFEDAVKTICTTNCAWSGTERMVGALVRGLGKPTRGGSERAFPTPEEMARASENFYRDTVRAGYRGAYLRQLAQSVVDGTTDLEHLADRKRLSDDDVEQRLLTLPGVGPYAASHIMMLLGRYSRLVLDSWTRPKYARLSGRSAGDSTIRRRFGRYRDYAGLAFWLYLTRDWVNEPGGGCSVPTPPAAQPRGRHE